MNNHIRVGITHGDYNGVGYEVILKALAHEGMLELMTPVLFGSSEVAASTIRNLNIEDAHFSPVKDAASAHHGRINIVDVCTTKPEVTPGSASSQAGAAALDALNVAVKALRQGDIDVLVTAPIDKNSIHNDEFHFPGHTEFLANEFAPESEDALMVLFADKLRVALVTTHLPISKVAENITRQRVYDSIKHFEKTLRKDFGVDRPMIAVLGLNPHCGDRGMIGTEEYTEILPAIDDAVEEGILAFGPFPADGFFASGKFADYDGVLAMYHDQGLAPFKSLAGQNGVNFTAGIDIIRTSPDHGTAYDIAGKGIADPQSMREAIYAAIDLYRNRRHYEEITANPLPVAKESGDQRKKNKQQNG